MPIQNSSGKVWRPLTIWARQNLQLLTSSKSGWRALGQILVDSVDSQTCRPQVIWRLRPLCFYGRRLSRTVLACCTGMTYQNFCGCPIFCALTNFHHFLWKIKKSISALSYHCTKNSYMITVAVQIQLPYSQTPKWRLSSTLGEVAKIWP